MLLEKGMNIYCLERFSNKLVKHEISKVTKKQAVVISKYGLTGNEYEIRFDREVGDGSYFCARGSSGYSRSSYSIETEELKAKYKRQCLERLFAKIDVKTLTDKQLEEILAII